MPNFELNFQFSSTFFPKSHFHLDLEGCHPPPAVATTAVGTTGRAAVPIVTTGGMMNTMSRPAGRHDGTLPGLPAITAWGCL